MAKVFLSHASADAPAAKAVAQLLHHAGLDVWLELDQIKPGQPWLPTLEAALASSTHFVVLVGPAGVQRWVEREVRYALERNTQNPSYVVIPLLLGAGIDEKSLPLFLRQHQYLSLDWQKPDLAVVQQVAAAISGAPAQRVNLLAPGESPFRGLLTFDASHSHLFFGRDREVDNVRDRLASGVRFLPIVGDSGSGKSSLVHAGLIPSLLRGRLGMADWRIATMQPGDDPLGALAQAMPQFDPTLSLESRSAAINTAKTHLHPQGGTTNLDALGEIFAVLQLPQASRQLLIIDQFEQLFTLAPLLEKTAAGEKQSWSQSPAARFIDIVLRAVQQPNSSLQAVITLRMDFFGLCGRHPELWKLLTRDQYTLPRMDQDRLRQIIVKPMALAGMPIDRHLADKLIDDVDAQPGGLALLEHALDRLWQGSQGKAPTLDHYKDIGRLQGALEKHADWVLQERLKTATERDLARRIFVELTALGEGTKDSARRVPKPKLEALGPGAAEVLQILAKERLVTMGDASEKDSVTIAHEALIREWKTLRQWVDLRRQDIRFQRDIERAADAWEKAGHDQDSVYRGRRLEQALEWRRKNEGECRPPVGPFIDAGRRRHRIARTIRRGSVLALIGVLFWLSLPQLESGWRFGRLWLAGRARVNPKDGLRYVYIPPGTAPVAGELRLIQIGKAFWIGQTEVTQAAYVRVMKKENPSTFKGEERPVETVSWDEASEYCQAAGGLRLPTEEEWEYAARAGSNADVVGNLDEVAWHSGNSGGGTKPVATRKPNDWGLHDMLGNVWEWTSSPADDTGGLVGPKTTRILRGGAWNFNPVVVRVSYRNRLEPAVRVNSIGFRCAGELP